MDSRNGINAEGSDTKVVSFNTMAEWDRFKLVFAPFNGMGQKNRPSSVLVKGDTTRVSPLFLCL